MDFPLVAPAEAGAQRCKSANMRANLQKSVTGFRLSPERQGLALAVREKITNSEGGYG